MKKVYKKDDVLMKRKIFFNNTSLKTSDAVNHLIEDNYNLKDVYIYCISLWHCYLKNNIIKKFI